MFLHLVLDGGALHQKSVLPFAADHPFDALVVGFLKDAGLGRLHLDPHLVVRRYVGVFEEGGGGAVLQTAVFYLRLARQILGTLDSGAHALLR